MAGTVFVTGASGFVGEAVVEELLERGYEVNALVHRRPILSPAGRVHSMEGDLFDPQVLERGMRSASAVIHLVGIIFEHPYLGVTFERMHFEGTRKVVDAAKTREDADPYVLALARKGLTTALADDQSHFPQRHHVRWARDRRAAQQWSQFPGESRHRPHASGNRCHQHSRARRETADRGSARRHRKFRAQPVHRATI